MKLWWKWHQNRKPFFYKYSTKNYPRNVYSWGCYQRLIYYAVYVHWHFEYRLCCVRCYLRGYHGTIPPMRLHRLYVCVKWLFTICQKRNPISWLQHQYLFWCHFHHILLRYHTLHISSNEFVFCHLWDIVTFKSHKNFYFEPHCK